MRGMGWTPREHDADIIDNEVIPTLRLTLRDLANNQLRNGDGIAASQP